MNATQLVDRWLQDPAFRAAFSADPVATALDIDAQLTEEEWDALRRIAWDIAAREVEERAPVA